MNFEYTFKCRFTAGFEKQYFWKVFSQGVERSWVSHFCSIVRNNSEEIGKTVMSIMREKKDYKENTE